MLPLPFSSPRARAILTACAAAFLAATVLLVSSSSAPTRGESPAVRRIDTRAREATARILAATAGPATPVRVAPEAGWAGQQLIGGTGNDWEPIIASIPGTLDAVVLTTRYGDPACDTCPNPSVTVATSSDGGATFAEPVPICTCEGTIGQYDPQITASGDGIFRAVWLDGDDLMYATSADGGHTWSAPTPIAPDERWADKPWLISSRDGTTLAVAFRGRHDFIVTSADGGATWSAPTPIELDGRTMFTNGGAILRDGTMLFAATAVRVGTDGRLNPTAPVDIVVVRSTDAGWHIDAVERTDPTYHCESSTECRIEGSNVQTTLAGRKHHATLLYAQVLDDGSQVITSSVSTDEGATWHTSRRLSPARSSADHKVHAATPAAVITSGDTIHVVFSDDRRGTRVWNTWYRSSSDSGATWSRAKRISDAVSGPAYVSQRGYASPYGDYLGITATADGILSTWGEGNSDIGPGGTWVNRTS